MEAVFIFTGIVILLVAVAIAWLASKAVRIRGDTQEDQEEDPCEKCLRWSECNGVDEDCPIKEADCHASVRTGSQ